MNPQNNAAIWYVADSFDASGKKLPIVGRTAAGEGFLKALATYGKLERIYCFTGAASGHDEFRAQIQRLCQKPPKTSFIEWSDFQKLGKPGCLYVPEPALEVHAWNRRSLGNQRSYSLCGITHTTAHNQTIDAIGSLLTAPLQSWDALICTSKVVHATVTRLLDDQASYLEDRGAGRITARPQLPVIPLGIDSGQFMPSSKTDQARKEFRQQLGAGDEDIVVLYLGRLSVNIKTNPYTMLSSLEKVATRTEKRIHLVLTGWFQDNNNMNAFSEAIKSFSPSVNTVLMDGRQDNIRKYIWYAADIFVSLIDNIQETFGISPVEAMAAGLPVVVTDWNGYRDTVINGKTGYRIPTAFPSRGAGEELAIRFQSGIDSYESYLGHCSAATIIDENACVEAFSRLVNDRNLRVQMGEAGRKHVRDNFDWEKVIYQYQTLWNELAERRNIDSESAPTKPGAPAIPLRQDPFKLFEEYPTTRTDDDTQVITCIESKKHDLVEVRNSSLFAAAMPLLLPENKCREILRIAGQNKPVTIGELKLKLKSCNDQQIHRSIAWLAKTGMIQIIKPKLVTDKL